MLDPIIEVRAALEEIDRLIDLIECSNKDNLALLPLFLAQQKRALAALAMIRAQVLEEAAQVAVDWHQWGPTATAAAIRAFKEQP